MPLTRLIAAFASVLALLTLAGCGAPRPDVADQRDVAALTDTILALGPDIDPEEAARAARIAYEHTSELAIQYQITDPPLVHNTKVNMGIKPRGLCWHWAEDIEKRLAKEDFQTLDLHRAIANADNPFRIEHSTTIVSAKGASMFDGVVVDPWRYGGILHWSPTREDTRYKWVPRQKVFEMKQERARRSAAYAS